MGQHFCIVQGCPHQFSGCVSGGTVVFVGGCGSKNKLGGDTMDMKVMAYSWLFFLIAPLLSPWQMIVSTGRSPLSLIFVFLSPALSMCLASSIFPTQSNLSWFFCCSVVAAYLVPMPSLSAPAPSQCLCLFLFCALFPLVAELLRASYGVLVESLSLTVGSYNGVVSWEAGRREGLLLPFLSHKNRVFRSACETFTGRVRKSIFEKCILQIQSPFLLRSLEL